MPRLAHLSRSYMLGTQQTMVKVSESKPLPWSIAPVEFRGGPLYGMRVGSWAAWMENAAKRKRSTTVNFMGCLTAGFGGPSVKTTPKGAAYYMEMGLIQRGSGEMAFGPKELGRERTGGR